MTTLHEILSAATPIEGGFRTEVPSDWLQGRTAYGGLSSALALHAAQCLEPDLPPLRSAQSVVHRAAGRYGERHRDKLRRGRNAAFIQADIVSDAGLGYRATFVFMADQVVADRLQRHAAQPAPPAGAGHQGLYRDRPAVHRQLQLLRLRDEAKGDAEWIRWARLRDYTGLDPMVELMAVGDALPPAAFKLFGKEFMPVSSLTWLVNVLTPTPRTTDGWWLLSAVSERAQHGCSSQVMTMWNADGEAVAQGMQSVAIFG